MAILYMEGFDGYVNSADFRSAGECVTQGDTLPILYSPNGGRFGGGALDLNASAINYYSISVDPVATGQKIYTAFWLKGQFTGIGGTFDTLVGFIAQGASTRLIRFEVNNLGVLRMAPQSGSNVDTAAGTLPNNTYVWMEIEVTLGTTALNGAFEVRMNGSTILSGTGIDNNTGADCVAVRFYGTAQDPLIDDIVIWDDQGTAPTSWIGESRISTYLPTANGAVQDWTPSAGNAYQAIDDALSGGADGDTTYIEADGAGEKARFAMGDIPDITTTIHAVAVKARVRKTKLGGKTMRGYIRSNGTESNGTTIGLTEAYKVRTLGIFPRNPDGNIAWLDAAVNAMEAGVEVVS